MTRAHNVAIYGRLIIFAMEIEVKDLKKSKYSLKISLPPEELMPYFQATYKKLAPEVKIAGFRPGKAPRKLVEETIGQARLLSESLEVAVQRSYFEAVGREKLIPICPPKVAIVKYPSWGLDADEVEGGLVFEAEIEVMPEVKLGNFSGVKVKKKKIAETKKSDIEKILLHLRRQKATFVEVERGAEKGDRVEINYEGSVGGVKKDAMSAKNQPLVLGEGALIPGFEDNLIGMKKNDEKEFEIKFPADFSARDFAGKTAKFKVRVVDLKEIKLPEPSDQFAASFGRRNIPDLTTAIEKSLKDEVENKARNELELEVIEKVLPYLEVIVPEGLVEQEISRIIAGMEEQIKNRGLKFEKYLESIKKTLPELRRDLRPTAEKNIRIGFLLGKIIEKEKIDQKDPDAGRRALDYLIARLVK
ncbi:trigger factor [Candidatus Berkelbacteria bacterium CG1_02_42_45]|uniref:Trigger factor n=1 Tax=Candidatus Berkelbacteria bacterium CG1_02_42_45 TaxID=1805036 RepID=A0A1J4RTU2_9BACT|nr:MAG: trigger factor [Candidatus Berkelbacteria bacterium CG1_02_42_45]